MSNKPPLPDTASDNRPDRASDQALSDTLASPASIYDADEAAPDDLWFLPDDATATVTPPLPRADQRQIFDLADWQSAQAGLSAELAAAALIYGALEERLSQAGEGPLHRLALQEVGGLGWWSGQRIGTERLALWVAQRVGSAGDDAQDLARAGWAVRRLTHAAAPSDGGWQMGIPAFLGHGSASGPLNAAANSPGGEMADLLDRAADLHPLVQSALLFQGWRLASDSPGRDIEAATMAARHAARMGRKRGPGFVPLALGGFEGLRATGGASSRLAGWLRGADSSALSALLLLDRVQAWQARAIAATADLSGRTPPALIAIFAAWPMVGAALAENLSGSSRAAVQRNLDRLQTRKLIREVTGQGRYRIWTANL